MMKRVFFVCGAIIIFWATYGHSAVTQVVNVIGVASPQNEYEEKNIEKLRDRAIRNAMDLAVQQVSGITISTERGGSLYENQQIVSHNQEINETITQENKHHSGALIRTEGYGRIIKIVREWQKNSQYYVQAEVAVDSRDEALKRNKCGYFWIQAGKPSISMDLLEDFNGTVESDSQDETLDFFRENLTRNGVNVSTNLKSNILYHIQLQQKIKSNEMAEYDAITMHCRLSFQIIDQERHETVAEYRAAYGPQAGFTEDQAKEECLRAIAPKVSEKLVRSLAEIMLERWNNGVEQLIVIAGMPSEQVASVSEHLQDLFRVTFATPARYTDGRYVRTVKFKGTGSELAQAILSNFNNENWHVKVRRVDNGEIDLQWLNPR